MLFKSIENHTNPVVNSFEHLSIDVATAVVHILSSDVWQRPTWPFSRSQENTRQGQDAPQNPAEYRRMPVNAAERHAVTVLGLETPYSKESLKACYRKQAKTAHPDLNPGKANAEERFKELREAYMTLLRPITK